jgi:hypothetical protein
VQRLEVQVLRVLARLQLVAMLRVQLVLARVPVRM